MAKKPVTMPPRLDNIPLINLEDADLTALEAHESREGEHYEAADISEMDLSGVRFNECEFVDLSAHDTNLRAASLIEVKITRMNAPNLAAPRSRLRDVAIDGSRLGSAEFYEASWQGVHIKNSKIGFLNLRGAKLEDVLFTNCTIDEIDLGGASANRIAFVDTTAKTLDVTRSQLENADLRGLEMREILGLDGLRGATLNDYQIAEMAELFARQLGIIIE